MHVRAVGLLSLLSWLSVSCELLLHVDELLELLELLELDELLELLEPEELVDEASLSWYCCKAKRHLKNVGKIKVRHSSNNNMRGLTFDI